MKTYIHVSLKNIGLRTPGLEKEMYVYRVNPIVYLL
jgi:hypothetical protein